jgi:hypothetical protein
MTKTFELNGKTYRTDAETLNLLRSIVPAAKRSNDGSAVQAVIIAGTMTGRIVEE